MTHYKVTAVSFFLLFFTFFLIPNANSSVLTLCDQELFQNFGKNFGDGSFGITDIAGNGVQFTLTNTTKMGLSDNFEVSPLAGGTGSHNADFSAFSSCRNPHYGGMKG